jgi:hypothetical protein
MSVICPACQTENRDSAMFCHGCAGRLAAFAAVGPPVPERAASGPGTARGEPAGSSAGVPARSPGWPLLDPELARSLLRLGMLALAVMLAFLAWFSYVTRKVEPRPALSPDSERSLVEPPIASAAAATEPGLSPPSIAPGPAPAPTIVATRPDTPRSPEEIVEGASGPGSARPAATEPLSPLTQPAGPRSPSAPLRLAAIDPRRGCGGLNFIFAAHCEAVHCREVPYALHPRCNAVRAQRQRDEARRNLSF